MPLLAHDRAPGREVGTRARSCRSSATDMSGLSSRALEGRGDLAQVVRRQGSSPCRPRCRSNRCTTAPGTRPGRTDRLGPRLVVVGTRSTVSMLEVGEHVDRRLRDMRLGVSHRRRRAAVDRAEVALAVDQRVAGRERLRHADEGRVDDRLTVRVVVAGRVAADLRALSELGPRTEVEVVHRNQDAALTRLQAVPDVRAERDCRSRSSSSSGSSPASPSREGAQGCGCRGEAKSRSCSCRLTAQRRYLHSPRAGLKLSTIVRKDPLFWADLGFVAERAGPTLGHRLAKHCPRRENRFAKDVPR